MSDNPSSPLLDHVDGENSTSERPQSQHSNHSHDSRLSKQHSKSVHSTESTPLLSRDIGHASYDDNRPAHQSERSSTATPSLRSIQTDGPKKKRKNWPIIIAIVLLFLLVVTILGLGFAAPAVVKEYAKEAIVFEPTDLSVDSFTSTGLKVRVQGNFLLNASKVQKKPVRDLGRFVTWIMRAVKSRPSNLRVYMPEYGNILLGVAVIPSITVDVRNGHTTHVDFLSDLVPGDIDGIRQIANDWLQGRLGQIRVKGVVELILSSGIFSLGKSTLSESLVLQDDDLPAIPEYKIKKLNFSEIDLPKVQKAVIVEVSLALKNEFPVTFTVPVLKFDILVDGCSPDQPHIVIADTITREVDVSPKIDVTVDVQGIIPKLPEILLTACPNTNKSPLDILLGDYINGNETTIYVRGSESPSSDAPQWLTDLLNSVVVPLPFPGRSFDGLIRDFSLANVHFDLPDLFAAPGSPKSQPRLSATVKALVNLPEEMNFSINVGRVRADADIYYHKKKLGYLDLNKWQKANSTRIEADRKTPAGLAIDSVVKRAPLTITDSNVFAELVEGLIFGGEEMVLGVKANVDVGTETALGKFVIRDLPAEGKFFVKPLSGGNFTKFNPQVGSLEIRDTTKSSLTFNAKINFTNPTDYSATIPYVNVRLLSNGSIMGNATTQDIAIVPGPNYNIPISSIWNPTGDKGTQVGRDLISQYISGFNTTLTIKTHAGTIPSHPQLGEALSLLPIQVPTPNLHPPKNPNHDDDNDQTPHFIDDATIHLLTSTCTLTLLSPLPTTLHITSLNATATHRGAIVGLITSDTPFAIPPGVSTSPYLPVEWSLVGIGFSDLKAALGGRLKVDAVASVGVRIGRWEERVRFVGKGLGAKVRL